MVLNLKSKWIFTLSSKVSPADGKVLHFGKVECGIIEQIKGVSYSLPVFLGTPTWNTSSPNVSKLVGKSIRTLPKPSSEEFCSQILKQTANTSLFYSVIYLAPGDYHRFHSPVNWEVQFRRHFAGMCIHIHIFCLYMRSMHIYIPAFNYSRALQEQKSCTNKN